jgi:hypothetical protein
MATTKKEQLKDLQDELDRIDQRIQSMAATLSSTITLSLKGGVDRARDLGEALEKGKDITKDLEKELKKSERSIEANLLKEVRLRRDLSDAMRNGNISQERSIRAKLNDLTLQKQVLTQTNYQLRQLQKINEEHKKENDLLLIAGSYLKNTAKPFTELFTVAGLFKLIIDAALKADAQTTELAKSLGISKDQAGEIRNNFVEYARASKDAFVTTDKLVEAQSQLTTELGLAVDYGGKNAEDFARLTKLMGLSVNEAGKLARMSMVNGTTIEATTKSIIKGSAASQRANKISVDQRVILRDVANLSEGILVKFNQNPEALGAAVVQARKLGLTLEQVDKVGESLLNWESSIENELKAELITGKQINLEKARYAALTGDQATLMRELSTQVGSLSDYQNLNVIAQKSLAEAFGLSRDEMSKMLLEQEKINKLGDTSQMTLDQQLEALRAQGEPLDSVLYKQIQQQSAQEKFNNAIEKLKDLIGNLVAGPLGKLIDGFASIASHASVLYGIMGALAGMSLVKLITGLISMATTMAASSVSALTFSSALTFGIAIPVILAAIAAGYGMMKSTSKEAEANVPQKVSDGQAHSSRGPFHITDRFGATAITTPGDHIAVSPNMRRGNEGGGNNDAFAQMLGDKLDKHFQAVANFVQRPAVINGEDPFARRLGSNATLGMAQVQSSYPLA